VYSSTNGRGTSDVVHGGCPLAIILLEAGKAGDLRSIPGVRIKPRIELFFFSTTKEANN
jgi:hypothetical protein